MRIVTWNCRIGGYRWKAARVSTLLPDVLVVQEVEPIDQVLLFDGEAQPTFRDRVGDPEYPRRAIGAFSYTETKLSACDDDDPMYCFRRYVGEKDGKDFQIAAVWTAPASPRRNSYRQAHEGLARHADWIASRPTIVVGDFNNNATYRGSSWKELIALTEPLGLTSAYHHFFKEDFGKETRQTHFHHGTATSAFHIDYCFIPDAWIPYLKNVEVGVHEDWCTVSDHVPMIVDLDFPNPHQT